MAVLAAAAVVALSGGSREARSHHPGGEHTYTQPPPPPAHRPKVVSQVLIQTQRECFLSLTTSLADWLGTGDGRSLLHHLSHASSVSLPCLPCDSNIQTRPQALRRGAVLSKSSTTITSTTWQVRLARVAESSRCLISPSLFQTRHLNSPVRAIAPCPTPPPLGTPPWLHRTQVKGWMETSG